MQQKLSVTGDIDSLFRVLPRQSGIKTEKDDQTLVFSAATPDAMVKFKRSLAIWLSDIIVENYEIKYIEKALNRKYCHLSSAEKREILSQAVNETTAPQFENRQDLISSRLFDYLSGSDILLIDGFVNFRLKEYKESLADAVDKAVDRYLTEREYSEFINLLRYFVQMQEPREPVIHIVSTTYGRYSLYDENANEITHQCIEDFMESVGDTKVNFDDLLISSLITLAPIKTVIHNGGGIKNREVLETIYKVFEGSVTACDGCSLCEKYLK